MSSNNVLNKWSDRNVEQQWYAGKGLTLDKLLGVARSYQFCESTLSTKSDGNTNQSSTTVKDNVSRRKHNSFSNSQNAPWSDTGNMGNGQHCFGCSGHWQKECPHKNKTCNKCHTIGLLVSVCRIKIVTSELVRKFQGDKYHARVMQNPDTDSDADEDFSGFIFMA